MATQNKSKAANKLVCESLEQSTSFTGDQKSVLRDMLSVMAGETPAYATSMDDDTGLDVTGDQAAAVEANSADNKPAGGKK